MNIGIELLTAISEVFIAWYFFSGVFGKSHIATWAKTAVVITFTALLTIFTVYLVPGILKLLLTLGLVLCFAKIYYRKPLLTSLYPTILFLLLAIISDVLCGTFLQANGMRAEELMGNGSIRVIYNSSGKLCHLLLIFISLTFIKFKMEKMAMLKALPLLVCQIISIVMYHFNFISALEGTKPFIINLEALGLLFINIIVCIYMEALNKYYIEKNKAELSQQQLEVEKNQYVQIMHRQEETRRLWHDIKKYFAAIETLASADSKVEMQSSLKNIKNALEPVENIYDTGNSLVDAILNYGAKKAADAGVKLRAQVWVDQHFNFPATDLFVIMGNTLDNAVEACEQLEDDCERLIYVQLRQKNHLLFYEIKNKYKPERQEKNGDIHGYGLKNVKACVDRNGGKILLNKENNVYQLSVSLNLEDTQI